MSSALLWQILRDRSSFLMKQKGARCTFTREPCNLKGKNNYVNSGLVHKKVLGVEPIKDKKGIGKGVAIITRRRGADHKPAKSFLRVELKRNSRRTMKGIKSLTVKNGYRTNLSMAALRRASALLRSQKAVVSKKTAKSKPAAPKSK